MNRPHSSGLPSARLLLMLYCAAVLLTGGFWAASTQTTNCPTNENQSWGQGKTVYIKFASSITADQRTGILRGLQAWNTANQSNNSRVTFTADPLPSGSTAPTLTFQSGGSSGTNAAYFDPHQVQTNTGPVQYATVQHATVTFYTGGMTEANRPIHDQAAANYIDFVQKLTVHEIGHSMGLSDAPSPNGMCQQTDGASVMNGYCGPNDMYGNMPMTPTSCDNGAVNQEYPPPAGTGGGGGDGGGGGGGDGGGGGGGDMCNPQYVEECGYDDQCDEWDPYSGTCTVYPGYDYCTGYWIDCP